jgi:hypothetical protein
MATVEELRLMTQETIAYYQTEKYQFPVPDSITGRKHLVSTYTRVWRFFEGLLSPEQYCEYASIVFNANDEYEYYKEFEPEVVGRAEIDTELKSCILALIDMELEDMQVEVRKLKKASKFSSGGVSVKAVQAVREIKDRVLQLVLSNSIKLEDVTEVKCHLISSLKL